MTTIINIVGAPGVGKSTLALALTSLMKMRGMNVEYVGEVIKGYIYSNDEETLSDEYRLMLEQNQAFEPYLGNVDYLVTDAPLMGKHVYTDNPILHQDEKRYMKDKDLIVIFVRVRDVDAYFKREGFESRGRIHGVEEVEELQKKYSEVINELQIGDSLYVIEDEGYTERLTKAMAYVIAKEINNK